MVYILVFAHQVTPKLCWRIRIALKSCIKMNRKYWWYWVFPSIIMISKLFVSLFCLSVYYRMFFYGHTCLVLGLSLGGLKFLLYIHIFFKLVRFCWYIERQFLKDWTCLAILPSLHIKSNDWVIYCFGFLYWKLSDVYKRMVLLLFPPQSFLAVLLF